MAEDRAAGPCPGPKEGDRHWLGLAASLAWLCPVSATAFSVGAVLVGADGTELSRGFSRETGPVAHAEQVALGRLSLDDPRLADATLYTSLEPCSVRASFPYSCTDLILATEVPRVVLALREPSLFVVCEGVRMLRDAGVEVVELPELAESVREANAHLLA